MVLPLVANVYQVTTIGVLYGHPCDHVVNWFVTGGTGGPIQIVDDLAQADHDQWITAFEHICSANYRYSGSRVVYLGDTTTAPGAVVANSTGLATGVFVPAFCAATVRHKFPGRGRGKDGRTNFPNFVIDLVDPTDAYHLTPAGVNELQLAFNGYFSGVAADVLAAHGNAAQHVILDRKLGTYSVPSSSLVDPYLNVHRRWAKRLARH